MKVVLLLGRIVVGRNLDSHGTLRVYLIESGKFANLLTVRSSSSNELILKQVLRRQLEQLSPKQEVAEEELFRLCPRLTTGNSRKRNRDDIAGDDHNHRGADDEEAKQRSVDESIDDIRDSIDQQTTEVELRNEHNRYLTL